MKKANTKLMIGVVLVIWSILGYQLWSTFMSDETEPTTTVVTNFDQPTYAAKETFELLPLEKDPFLGTIYRKPSTNNAPSAIIKKDTLQWPQISYVGLVSDANAQSPVFILSVNGSQHLLKIGQEIEGIKVIRGTSEKIKLAYRTKTKEFLKQ